jgi:hypothetical protein
MTNLIAAKLALMDILKDRLAVKNLAVVVAKLPKRRRSAEPTSFFLAFG